MHLGTSAVIDPSSFVFPGRQSSADPCVTMPISSPARLTAPPPLFPPEMVASVVIQARSSDPNSVAY